MASYDDACARQPVAGIFGHYLACFSRISPFTDNSGPKTLHLIDAKPDIRNFLATLAIVVTPLSACGETQPEAIAGPAVPVASTCGERGRLEASLTGAIDAEIDWPDTVLRCDSMPRPDAEGVRLRFSGPVGDERLAIIIALPELHADESGGEFDSNVTVTVEGSGRFFSTPNFDTCWTDVANNEPLADQSGTHNVIGGLSCVGPLGEINGDGFVDIRRLRFSGIAAWSSK